MKQLHYIKQFLDAEGLGRGWKTGKSKDYKYKKTVVLAENAHLTLVCPEYGTCNNDLTYSNFYYAV